jgi:hypothetical protein
MSAKSDVLSEIFTAVRALAATVNPNQSLRVTFNPAALTSAVTQSASWTMGLQGVGGLSMNDANLTMQNDAALQTFSGNVGR